VKKYIVKLIMSDEYIIHAETPEEAKEKAVEKFGNGYLIDEVEVIFIADITDSNNIAYKSFDCSLSEEYATLTCIDEWGVATLWLNNKQGVEYNFCVDNGHNSCAIYKMYYNEKTEAAETDYSTFEHYEINYESKNWKEELEAAMYSAAKKFFTEKASDTDDTAEMTCTYFEYREMTEKLFFGVALTDNHLNNATEQIRQYLVNGGAGDVINALGIGIKVVTKSAALLPEEIVSRRFIWLNGERKGAELDRYEIMNIGMFLKHGAFYGKYNKLS